MSQLAITRTLPGPLRASFDRMLIAQAMLECMPLVSNEASFNAYGIRRVW
jgi:PIN domain nuclease of toxin-antitoxin system